MVTFKDIKKFWDGTGHGASSWFKAASTKAAVNEAVLCGLNITKGGYISLLLTYNHRDEEYCLRWDNGWVEVYPVKNGKIRRDIKHPPLIFPEEYPVVDDGLNAVLLHW